MTAQFWPRGLFLACGLLAAVLFGTPVDGGAASFVFTIDGTQFAPLGGNVSVPVYKSSGTDPFYGFDFLIAYDTAVLTLTGVTPGEIFDIPGSYEWEQFAYTGDSSGIPTGRVRATGIADIFDGHNPVTNLISDGTAMFTLNFTVTDDTAYECNWDPIVFFWTDCGDNVLATDSLGIELGISSQVYHIGGIGYQEVTDPGFGFPGAFGAPDECVTGPTVTRAIDLYGGGVDIECIDQIDDRGDVNCNGIAYEIADHIIFTNYFLNGLSAFGDNAECSQGNSDANADGIYLQLEDLVYIYRVIIGDVLPYPRPSPRDTIPLIFTQDNDTKTISLDYTDSLAAIQLVFSGDVIPEVVVDLGDGWWDYSFDGMYTRVMISHSTNYAAQLPEQFMASGTILTYSGDALLVEVRGADFYDNIFHPAIESHGSGITIPYTIEIGETESVPLGSTISIPVIKKTGSEETQGFDFTFGYDAAALTITGFAPGPLFDIPGEFEWEHIQESYNTDCSDPECPTGLYRLFAIADNGLGSHEPLSLIIPDGTTLFTLECEVTTDLTYGGLFIPMRFYWNSCSVNGIAFGTHHVVLAVSDHVYDYDGLEITDPDFGLPGYVGAPDSCFDIPDNPSHIVNFRNGGVQLTSLDSMELIVTIDSVAADPGDTAIYVDVHMSNPQDSVVAFSLHVLMDRPDFIEFGRSPDDTIAVEVQSTLLSDWDVVVQTSLFGTYHDIKINAISNHFPPYTNGIPPEYDGILLRLIVHSYADVPNVLADSTTSLVIDELPSETGFSDPDGNLIGLDGGQYNPLTVAFDEGYVTIEGALEGDTDGDGVVNIADAVFLINYIFNGGPAPDPLCIGDVNCDGDVNISDAVYLVVYVFQGGGPPVPNCCL